MRESTGAVPQQFPTRSYLADGVRASSISVLNQCLVDVTAMSMQLKDAHWNVKGIEFYQLHELFEDLYEEFEDHIDEIAERVSALGGQAYGTPSDVVQNSSIPPLQRGNVDGRTLLDQLAYRLSVLDANLYQAIETANRQNDLDTADLLNEVSRDVSKSLWFVESHLQA
jgi:starvation-inducible DNA-binding protein